jgi:hypothetical protein
MLVGLRSQLLLLKEGIMATISSTMKVDIYVTTSVTETLLIENILIPWIFLHINVTSGNRIYNLINGRRYLF